MTRRLSLLVIFWLILITLFANENSTRLANLPYTQNFDNPEFPVDWMEVSDGTIVTLDRWYLQNSSFFGGEPYELLCMGTPGVGNTRLISPQLNTAGIPAITVQFLYGIGIYDLGTVFKVQYSHDLLNWYDSSWASFTVGYNQGGLVRVTIENLNASSTYISWTLEGDQMGIEGAGLDNIYIHLPVTELAPPVVIISDGAMISWEAVPNALS